MHCTARFVSLHPSGSGGRLRDIPERPVLLRLVRCLPQAVSLPENLTGRPYTTLGYHNGPGYTGASEEQTEGPKRFPHFGTDYMGITSGRPDLTSVESTEPSYLPEAAVPLGSETHGGEDVAIYARGPVLKLIYSRVSWSRT